MYLCLQTSMAEWEGFGPVLRISLRIPDSKPKCLGSSPSCAQDSAFLLLQPVRAPAMAWSIHRLLRETWAGMPAPAFAQPSPALPTVGEAGVTWQTGSPCLCPYHANKTHKTHKMMHFLRMISSHSHQRYYSVKQT